MNKKQVLIIFGNKIRDLRISKGYTQEGLANEANLHRTYIGMIERGEKNITLLNIEKIAKALNTSIKSLYDD